MVNKEKEILLLFHSFLWPYHPFPSSLSIISPYQISSNSPSIHNLLFYKLSYILSIQKISSQHQDQSTLFLPLSPHSPNVKLQLYWNPYELFSGIYSTLMASWFSLCHPNFYWEGLNYIFYLGSKPITLHMIFWRTICQEHLT